MKFVAKAQESRERDANMMMRGFVKIQTAKVLCLRLQCLERIRADVLKFTTGTGRQVDRMSDDLISEQALHQKIDKIKVSSAEIVVHGTKEKPYYEIKYFDLSDNEMHIGFSSYKLDVVFGYLEKYFEIVEKGGIE